MTRGLDLSFVGQGVFAHDSHEAAPEAEPVTALPGSVRRRDGLAAPNACHQPRGPYLGMEGPALRRVGVAPVTQAACWVQIDEALRHEFLKPVWRADEEVSRKHMINFNLIKQGESVRQLVYKEVARYNQDPATATCQVPYKGELDFSHHSHKSEGKAPELPERAAAAGSGTGGAGGAGAGSGGASATVVGGESASVAGNAAAGASTADALTPASATSGTGSLVARMSTAAVAGSATGTDSAGITPVS